MILYQQRYKSPPKENFVRPLLRISYGRILRRVPKSSELDQIDDGSALYPALKASISRLYSLKCLKILSQFDHFGGANTFTSILQDRSTHKTGTIRSR